MTLILLAVLLGLLLYCGGALAVYSICEEAFGPPNWDAVIVAFLVFWPLALALLGCIGWLKSAWEELPRLINTIKTWRKRNAARN